jgi:translation elongation factor EF-1beta
MFAKDQAWEIEQMTKPITLTLVVKILPEHFDTDTLSWVQEVKEKAMEQGKVTSCTITDLPPVIEFIA